ncbi:IS3 family transposase [Halomonas litopenaei]|uniref:IS3 family transposase n=1 Tax=Halomonas litopenaei TaxID=2109328 RepID=UPI003FA0B218
MKYAFIQANAKHHPVRRLCRILRVHPSGYYAWCRDDTSRRAQEDERLRRKIRQHWHKSGGRYGYRKIHQALTAAGERCGKHRVAKLMREEGLRSKTGHGRPSGPS